MHRHERKKIMDFMQTSPQFDLPLYFLNYHSGRKPCKQSFNFLIFCSYATIMAMFPQFNMIWEIHPNLTDFPLFLHDFLKLS